MSTEINDGGPAFPIPLEVVNRSELYGGYIEQVESHGGMSLRDYFAARAMAAIYQRATGECLSLELLSSSAYEIADAMLIAREEQP